MVNAVNKIHNLDVNKYILIRLFLYFILYLKLVNE